MEGRAADEAHEQHLIERMTVEERADRFRDELNALRDKWRVPESERRAIEDPNSSPRAALAEALRRASIARDEQNSAAVWIVRATELLERERAARRPDIRTDADAVRAIDDLLYALKMRHNAPIADALKVALDELVSRLHLDSDPHAFASEPPR